MPPAARVDADVRLPARQASEKDSRTPAQRKINSQLLYEIYRARGQAEEKKIPPGPTGIKPDARRRAFVDIRADVTAEIRRRVEALDATIVSASAEHRSILAWVPLLKIEELAGLAAVRAIEPAAEATTVR